MKPDLPIVAFRTLAELHHWLEQNHKISNGIFVRLYRKGMDTPSVSFEEVLEEGLCFGWSESMRLPYDSESYLQKFTPRRTKGTVSERNKRYVAQLINEGRMMPEGLLALGMQE